MKCKALFLLLLMIVSLCLKADEDVEVLIPDWWALKYGLNKGVPQCKVKIGRDAYGYFDKDAIWTVKNVTNLRLNFR